MRATLILIVLLLSTPLVGAATATGTATYTYLGGGGNEAHDSVGVATDQGGNIYVAGVTTSNDLLVTPGVYDASYNGVKDAFIAKLSPDLKTLLALTYLGGSREEMCCDIKLTPSGDVVVSGSTASADFPIVDGAQPDFGGGQYDVFVAVLSGDLTTLKGSSFLGGSGKELGFRGHFAVNAEGDIYVACYTESFNYPVTPGAYDTSYGGQGDGGVSVFSPDAGTLRASTYIGGSGNDWPYPLALGVGRVYVGGHVNYQGYPTTQGAYDASYNGGDGDVFLAALDPDLKTLLASTYLGASDFDNINSIYVEPSGDVVVAGHTGSNGFPTTEGAYSRTYRGGTRDSFVTRLDADLKNLKASTFIGGGDTEFQAYAAPGEGGDVIVNGATKSGDYPYTSGVALGGDDTVIMVLDAALSGLRLSVPLGGSGDDTFGSIIFVNGAIYAVTSTKSSDVQCTGYDPSFNGGQDVLVARLEYPTGTPLNPQAPPASSGGIPAYPLAAVALGIIVCLMPRIRRR